MSADQRLATASAFRPRLSATLAIGALGLGLLATPSGIAIAKPAAPTQASTASRQAPDSLFPEVGSSRYDVKHYAISLSFQSSGNIKAKTSFTAKAKKPLKSFSLDLEGLIVDKVRVNGRTADFSRRDNKLIIKPSKTVAGRFSASIRYHGKPVTHIDPDGAQDGWIPTDNGAGATVLSEPIGAMTWFPNNNTPRDKATFDMKITVPTKLEVGWQRRPQERPELCRQRDLAMGAALPAGDVPGHDLDQRLRRLPLHYEDNDRTQAADLELH